MNQQKSMLKKHFIHYQYSQKFNYFIHHSLLVSVYVIISTLKNLARVFVYIRHHSLLVVVLI